MKYLKALSLPKKIFAITTTGIFGIFSYFVLKTAYWTRMFADDYCTAGILHSKGFWGAQVYWYEHWSGRFSYDLAVHCSEIFGMIAIRFLPVILVGLFVASLALVFVIFYRLDEKKVRRVLVSTFLAAFIAPLIITAAPNVYQVLYWQTGSLTYFIPFIFFNIVLALIYLRATSYNKLRIISIAALAFFAGGFSESYIVLQISILSMLIVYGLIWGKKEVKNIRNLGVALLSSIVSMIVVIAAPGNTVRSASLPARTSLVAAIYETILKSGSYVLELIKNKPFMATAGVLFVLGLVLSKVFLPKLKESFSTIIMRFLYLVGCGFAIVCAVFLPGLYALGSTPPERTLFLIVYPLLMLSFVLGLFSTPLIERLWPKKEKAIVVVLVTTAAIILSLLSYNRYISESKVLDSMRVYGMEWDVQNKVLEASRGSNKTVIVNVLRPIGDLDVIWTDRNSWVNSCAANYYKVGQVIGK
ncbi:MAG: hypothetical protein Q8912_05060 [Bacillota bacterium]|nr:hypothetical protein [Bacillota bacterium]